MATVQAEVRDLVSYIRSQGFQCAIEKDGHWHIYKGGKPVLKEDGGPVTLPGTPSYDRWRANSIAMLKKAKVIVDDPLKERQRELAKRDPDAKATREQARKALEERRALERKREENRQPSVRQLVIRDAIKNTLETLDGSTVDFLRLVEKTAVAKGLRTPKSLNAMRNAYDRLYLAGAYPLAEWILDCFEATLVDIGAMEPSPQQPKQEVETMETPAPAETGSELTVESLLGNETTGLPRRTKDLDRPGRRLEGGKVQCGCGYVSEEMRGLKAHVRAKHIELQCPDCEEWFKGSGITNHRKWAHGLRTATMKAKPETEAETTNGAGPMAVPAAEIQKLIDNAGKKPPEVVAVAADAPGPAELQLPPWVAVGWAEELAILSRVAGAMEYLSPESTVARVQLETLITRRLEALGG